MLFSILKIIFSLFILAIAIIIGLVYSSYSDYNDRQTLREYKPYLFDLTKPHYTYPKVLYLEGNFTPFISLIMPAYNEEFRLSASVETNINFFSKKNISYEIIIVNDGSKDNTIQVIQSLIEKYSNVSIIGVSYRSNGGKGYAVKTGMERAKGKYLLMLDSDSATSIEAFDDLFEAIEGKEYGIAIGSRKVVTEKADRVWYRNIMGMINNFIIRKIIGVGEIKDTQCGFKLFTRKAAQVVFSNVHIVRWAFDVDCLYIAKIAGIDVIEIAVNWREMEGSKLVLIPATFSFIRDFTGMIVLYKFGIWKVLKPIIRKID